MMGEQDWNWRPIRGLEFVAGTPPGGGLDRAARALVKAVTENKLAEQPVSVLNVPGDGARAAWRFIDQFKGDGHVVSISSPNLITDKLVGLASFDERNYSPVAILYTEYIVFITGSDGRIADARTLLKTFSENAASLTVSLSTALGNPNHIAVSRVAVAAGGDVRAPTIRVFDTALDVVDDVVAGRADIGAVTAASIVKALEARQLRPIALSAPERLGGLFGGVPTWHEHGVDCVTGAWRGITGPAGLSDPQLTYWQDLLGRATATQAWTDELDAHYWTAKYLDGPSLHTYLERERKDYARLLKSLGLIKT